MNLSWVTIVDDLGKSVSSSQGRKWPLEGGDPKAYRGGSEGHGSWGGITT